MWVYARAVWRMSACHAPGPGGVHGPVDGPGIPWPERSPSGRCPPPPLSPPVSLIQSRTFIWEPILLQKGTLQEPRLRDPLSRSCRGSGLQHFVCLCQLHSLEDVCDFSGLPCTGHAPCLPCSGPGRPAWRSTWRGPRHALAAARH